MDPKRENLTDAQALKFIRGILALESNRIIKKCIAESEFFYHTFRFKDGVKRKESAIRLADVLSMTFLQIKFSPVFEFISNNMLLVLDDSKYANDLVRYSKIRNKYKEDKESFRLTRWIQDEISLSGNKIDLLPNAEIIEQIFALSLRCFCSIIYQKSMVDRMPIAKMNSTSDSQVLLDFFRSVDSGKKSKKARNAEIYRQHINGDEILKGLEYSELIKYARWICTVANVSSKLNLDVVKCIRSIWDDPDTFVQYGLSDTLRFEGASHFCFQLLEVFEKLERQKDDQMMQEAKMLLEEFLTNQDIDSTSKVFVISSFCIKHQQSKINSRLCKAFDNIADEKTQSTVRFAFDQINSRYINGTEDIFSKEEDFFYVLYQNWSGSTDNPQETEGIQKAIKRVLKKHSQAVKYFWEQFPFKETWMSIEDMLEDDELHSAFPSNLGRSLFISLSDLIDTTRQIDIQDSILQRKVDWWAKCMRDNTVMDKLKVQPDGTTLRSILEKFLKEDHLEDIEHIFPGLRWAEIPAGTFGMGSKEGGEDEKPIHSVELGSFRMSATPVTQMQYENVMGVNPSEFRGKGRRDTTNHPVENVSWTDAMVFCEQLTKLIKEKGRITLPTEAQWEYACRGGEKDETYDKLDKIAWYESNSKESTQEVRTKTANKYGLYDMLGNVWEWCADWYGEKYYAECQKQGAVENPMGPETGSHRVLRGGGWDSGGRYCRCAYRYDTYPGLRYDYIGFRVVVVPE